MVLSIPGAAHAVLFGVQPATGNIVQIDPTTGNVQGSFPAPDSELGQVGLSGAEGGSVLLYGNSYGWETSGQICRIDPQSGELLSTHDGLATYTVDGLSYEKVGGVDHIFIGSRVIGVVAQKGYGSGIYEEFAFDRIWGALGGDGFGRGFVAAEGAIHEFDPTLADLTSISSFAFESVSGLAFDGQYLYASRSNGTLYTLNPNDGSVVRMVSVPTGSLSGLAIAVPEPIFNVAFIAYGYLRCGRRRAHHIAYSHR